MNKDSIENVGRGRYKKEDSIENGAVAEWSKSLLLFERINENQKIPGFLRSGQSLKNLIEKKYCQFRDSDS